MKWVATAKRDQNRAVIDPWTIVHLGAGLAAGLMEARTEWAVGAAVAWEGVEQFVERRRWGKEVLQSSGPEAAANASMDLIVFAVGLWLGRQWNDTGRRGGDGSRRSRSQ